MVIEKDSTSVDGSSKADTSDQKELFSSVEYFQSLEKWVQEMYFMQNFNAFWYNTLLFSCAISSNPVASQPLRLRNSTSGRILHNGRILNRRGAECHLPPIWKRLTAEFIDFIILFMVKLIATYTMIDFFNVSGWDRRDFDALLDKTLRLDYNAAIELTSELMVIEIAHRITVCLYETYWLCCGFGVLPAGATPGKRIMNLIVIHCNTVSEFRFRNNRLTVLVEPGTILSPLNALLRSVIKNFVLAVFLPLTFMFMYLQNNRTGYDIISQSIVVEDPRNPVRQRT